jgi:CBS domain-containing protein
MTRKGGRNMRGTDFMVGGKSLKEMTADHLMQRDPATYYPDVTGHTLANAVIKSRSGGIPIVDHAGRLVGIVTEFDLLKALMESKDLEKITATELMTENPVTVCEKTSATEILDVLETGHLIHLPVVDYEGRLVGMIERYDVLAGYLESKLGPLSAPF